MAEPKDGIPITTSNERSQVTVNIANYLRNNKALKQRTGLLNNTEDVEFFRFKRLVRALLSDDYKTKQQNPKNGLVPLEDEKDISKIFISLIQSQFVIPVEKLHYHEIKKTNKSWKPNRTKPTLKQSNKANIEPNAYFVWTYTKPNPFILLYSFLLIAGIFAVILFPLWPNFMKIGVWYMSMGLLGLLGLFFLIAIIRLIIYLVTLLVLPKAFWLYPNLFEDCGVIESFQPLYGWDEPKKSKKGKSKKGKSKKSKSEAPKDSSESASTTGAKLSDNNPTKRKVVLEEVDE